MPALQAAVAIVLAFAGVARRAAFAASAALSTAAELRQESLGEQPWLAME